MRTFLFLAVLFFAYVLAAPINQIVMKPSPPSSAVHSPSTSSSIHMIDSTWTLEPIRNLRLRYKLNSKADSKTTVDVNSIKPQRWDLKKSTYIKSTKPHHWNGKKKRKGNRGPKEAHLYQVHELAPPERHATVKTIKPNHGDPTERAHVEDTNAYHVNSRANLEKTTL